MMVPALTEICRSRFCIFNVFLTILRVIECISWIIKCLLLLMHGVTMKICVYCSVMEDVITLNV